MSHMPDTTMPATFEPVLVRLVRSVIQEMERISHSAVALCARVFPAAVFWMSGRTKVEGWRVSQNAIDLFRDEYQLPLIDPAIAAHLATFAEHAFPILLVLGLATRFAALALLVMTLVIQLFVYPGAWPIHGVWATCFLLLIARGPGVLSIDHLIARRFG
jgi:putative oxidoreductase